MAADNELQIVLNLIDNASTELKKITSDIKKDTDEVSKQSDKAGKSIKDNFREAGKELKSYRQSLFAVTAVMGTMILTSREWSKHNLALNQSFHSLNDITKQITANLGSLLAPAIINLTKLLEFLAPIINQIVGYFRGILSTAAQAFGYLTNFVVAFTSAMSNGANAIEAFKIATFEAKEAAKSIAEEFKTAFQEDINQYVAENINAIQQLKYQYNAYYDERLIKNTIATQHEIEKLQFFVSTAKLAHQSLWLYASQVRDSFVQGFGNSMAQLIVEGGKFKDVMVSFLKELITQVISLIIQMLTLKAVFSLFGFHTGGTIPTVDLGTIEVVRSSGAGGSFHKGGLIYAHSGLAVDEVPIIAQTGEGVLSRRGMAALGGSGVLNRLNNGYGGSQITVQNYIYNPVIRSDEDIDKLTEEISLRLAREAERL